MAIIKNFKIKLGKMDLDAVGKYNHLVELEVELREHKDLANGELSICGMIGHPNRTGLAMGGQIYDSIDVALLEPEFRDLFLEIREVWRRWHLNDMRAGSPAQMDALRAKFSRGSGSYEKSVAYLKELGIYNDPALNGYTYGSKWLREELPEAVVAQILSWEAPKEA